MTAILAAVFAPGFLIILILYVAYRRQIKNICRLMSYLEQKDTNKLVTTDSSAGEVVELAEQINSLNLAAKQKIQEYRGKDERLKEVIANLSHDIRTPLTSMDGYFQLLRESGEEEERQRYLTVIQGRIENLTMLLEELFTYSKLQNDSYVMEVTRENATQIVCDAVFSFYQEMKKCQIQPDIDFEEEPVYMMCSKAAVSRIVSNLIKNALAHGEKHIRMSWKREDGVQVFTCSNSVNDPEEVDIGQVFDRFYKADSSRSSHYGYTGQHTSTGLGLAIAKELAEKMGGSITAGLEGNIFTVKVYLLNSCNKTY